MRVLQLLCWKQHLSSLSGCARAVCAFVFLVYVSPGGADRSWPVWMVHFAALFSHHAIVAFRAFLCLDECLGVVSWLSVDASLLMRCWPELDAWRLFVAEWFGVRLMLEAPSELQIRIRAFPCCWNVFLFSLGFVAELLPCAVYKPIIFSLFGSSPIFFVLDVIRKCKPDAFPLASDTSRQLFSSWADVCGWCCSACPTTFAEHFVDGRAGDDVQSTPMGSWVRGLASSAWSLLDDSGDGILGEFFFSPLLPIRCRCGGCGRHPVKM
ncbi:hypothetical protein Nepgr_014811 [Nepenthes gracilis]|uniref:Transmembrane protein n=1 Tax=Nepenthes gracilis TaxID=150966 RepID=A0AAD3SLL8_NEPGR|nr:hypothetical protein Nepgr_014811 [Nepenthes gracilis]